MTATAPDDLISEATEAPPAAAHRRLMPAGRALVVGLICFAAWITLDARNLERSAAAGPLGPRRTLVLTFLKPLRRITAFVSLDRASILLDEALGRNVNGPVAGGRAASRHHATTAAHGGGPQAPAAAAPVVVNVTSPVATPTTAPPSSVQPLRQPTPADPLRVLVVGDSIAKDFGESLIERLTTTGLVNATLDARPSTGLSRPDYFDWDAQLASDVQRFNPELVVAMFGGNDAQSFLVNGHAVQFATPLWTATYASRVAQFAAEATSAGRHLLWVGMPIMSSSSFSASMQVLNSIDRTSMQALPAQTAGFFDCWSLFADSSGHYAAYLTDSSGHVQLMRHPDGIHLSRAGADRLAVAVIADVQTRFGVSFRGS